VPTDPTSPLRLFRILLDLQPTPHDNWPCFACRRNRRFSGKKIYNSEFRIQRKSSLHRREE
jgi:hypothetical protein